MANVVDAAISRISDAMRGLRFTPAEAERVLEAVRLIVQSRTMPTPVG